MWKQPWGYKEGYVICGGLFLTGLSLQAAVGGFHLETLAYPINLLAAVVFFLLLLLLHFFRRKFAALRWLSSYQAAISSISSLALLTLVMGLVKQLPSYMHEGDAWPGFAQMLSNWAFAFLFVWFIAVLGMTVFLRLFSAQWKDIPFVLNHLGLLIALTGAVLGSADIQQLEMNTLVGRPQWMATNERGDVLELPLAIELHGFSIEEYPPKLMLIDNETGDMLPKGKPDHFLVEDSAAVGKLLDWDVAVITKLPMAAGVPTGDTLKYVEFHSVGATMALYIRVSHRKTGETHEGWVSCGNYMFPYKAMRLNEKVSLVMPEPEPKRFYSDVTVYTESGKTIREVIEVNKPVQVDGWKIYQLGYDESKGRWSDVSVFQLVRDPWLPVVYTGILMMIAGALALFVFQKRKEGVHDKLD